MKMWACCIAVLLVSQRVFAATCDIDSLTDNCKVFDPKKPYVTLKNGKRAINFSYDHDAEMDEKPERSKEETEKQRLQGLKTQAKALEILSKPKKKISENFKLYLMNELPEVNYALSGEADKEFRINVYYPPDSASGSFKAMKADEFRTLFSSYYSPQQLTELGGLMPPEPPEQGEPDVHPVYQDQKPLTSEARVGELMKFAKGSIVKKILAGRKREDLSAAERDALHKVESVSHRVGTVASDNSACSGVTPNAFYDPGSHQISVCPNFLHLPEAAVISVLGHEVAHAIDPCLCQFGLYSLDRSRAQAFMAANKRGSVDKDMASALRFAMSQEGDKFTSANLFQAAKDPDKVLKDLESKGVIKKETGEYDYTQFPFGEVSQCLSNLQFRATSTEREGYFKDLKSSGAVPAKEADKLEQAFKKHPECLPVKGKSSQMGEAFADWFGAQVASDYSEQINKKMDPLESMFFFANVYCSEKNSTGKPKSLGESIDRIEGDRTAAHPPNRKRMEDIYLRAPALAKAVGCTPKGPQCTHTPSGEESKPPEVTK